MKIYAPLIFRPSYPDVRVDAAEALRCCEIFGCAAAGNFYPLRSTGGISVSHPALTAPDPTHVAFAPSVLVL